MINLALIKIQAFGSIIEPLTYRLDSPGINLILGKNGRGKTTIFNALTWCIWGKKLKPDSSIEPWPNVIGNDDIGTSVEVSMSIGADSITIDRTPKAIQLWINDELWEKDRNKKDVQAKIDSIMGISFDLAKNSIIFGQKLTRLLAQKGEEQKRLFDEAFEVNYIGRAREKAMADYDTAKGDMLALQTDYTWLNSQYIHKLEAYKTIKDFDTKHKEQVIKAYEDELSKLWHELKGMKEDEPEFNRLVAQESALALKIQKQEEKLEKFHSVSKKQFQLDLELTQLRAEEKGRIEKVLELKKKMASANNRCPMCHQELRPEEFKKLKAKWKEEFNALMKLVGDNAHIVSNKERELRELDSSISEFKKLKDLQSQDKIWLNQLIDVGYDQCSYRPGREDKILQQKEQIEKKILAEKSKVTDLAKYLLELKKIKEDAFKIKPQYLELKAKVKLLSWVLDKPLGNKGLKAYIFNSMLGQVNTNLAQYSKAIGFTIQLKIDLESARKNFEALIFNKLESPISYTELSGGQQQLADVALVFAIHELFEDRFNILVADELFESLDDENVDIVYEMLENKALSKSLHIITHQKTLPKVKVNKVIKLVLQAGRTTIA